MSSERQFGLGRFFLVTQIDQAKLYLCLHQNRFDEKEKIGWRNRKLRWIGGHLYALPKLFSQTAWQRPPNGLPGSAGYIRDMPESTEDAGKRFSELVSLMRRLRAPGGCPWDRKQTFDSIKPYTLEETYEVLDAIDSRDWAGLSEELGDLMLQPVFLAEIAEEKGLFTIADSLQAINEKLVRRHPHIFGSATAETAEDVKLRWNEIKAQEKAGTTQKPAASILESTPRSLPALVEAHKISTKAAEVGFEWQNVDGVLEKLVEEGRELTEAVERKEPGEVEHEIGDLLFTLVNLARFYRIDPEQALRKTNARFRRRFAFVEQRVAEEDSELRSTSLDRMEELWQEAKTNEKTGSDLPLPSGLSVPEPG
jgi:tetrapyrrole methylase family protein/MazG family protein